MFENQDKKTMVSLITSLIAMTLSIVINFFLSPYIVENFGEEANGFTQLANNFINYASLITIALNSMSGRFITIAYHRKDNAACNKYYSSVIVGNIVIIIFLFLPAVYCVVKLDSLINIETVDITHVKWLFAFVFLNFFVSQVNSVFSIAFYVKNSQYLQNVVNMFRMLINAGGLLIVFSVLIPKIYFVSFVGVVLSILTLPVFMVLKHKIMPEVNFHIRYFDKKAIWEMVSSGLWNTLNQCGNLLMTGLDLLLSNLFIGPVQMGILSIAKTIPNCIIQLAGTVNTNFSPNLTIAYAKDDKKKIIESLRYAMISSSVLISIPIVVLCVYGEVFYSLWVPSLDARQLTVLSFLSCLAYIPFAGPQVLYNVFTTANKLKINSISVICGGIINFILVFFLLRHTDLELVAVAGVSSIISIIRNLIITVPYTARLLGLKWYTFYRDVLMSCICCIISACICLIIQRLISPDNWILLIISVVISCVIGVILLFVVFLTKRKYRLNLGE